MSDGLQGSPGNHGRDGLGRVMPADVPAAAEPSQVTYLVRQDGVWPFIVPAGLLGEELKLLTTRTQAQTHGPVEPCRPP